MSDAAIRGKVFSLHIMVYETATCAYTHHTKKKRGGGGGGGDHAVLMVPSIITECKYYCE